MNRRQLLVAACAATALLSTTAAAQAQAPAAPVDVAGIKYAPTVQMAGSTLQLNGAGLRTRFVIKVYTAGLYMGTKASTPEAALATPGPKRMHVVMLRDIDANELGRLFTRGMQDNAPREAFSKFIPGTLALADIFSAKKKLLTGDNFSIDYVPGVGTSVLVNGKAQGEPVKEPEFFNALLRIWLGPKPADESLKAALLGRVLSNAGGSPGQQ
ncbi:MAG: chalcone isomerase family protein [Rubrivivax sp.]|nr:chalcone isomerase family protein [Rubrivivax sp.]